MPLSDETLALLDRIEAQEMRSLEWGYTGGGLSRDEACALFPDPVRAEEALEILIESKLVYEHNGAGGSLLYRSRFAEMMRLLGSNRQLFPNRPWQGAPGLVADFRIDRRPRRFPKRECRPETILARHNVVIAPNAL